MEFTNRPAEGSLWLSRELKRNRGQRGYRPKQAHRKAVNRRSWDRSRIPPQTWGWIEEKIREDWSPEQITLWMKKYKKISVSHEWIYQYIYADKRAGGNLHKHLRCQENRRKRYGSNNRRGKLVDRASIEQRPEVVDERNRLGDWEADTVIGKKSPYALVTLVERKSRFTLLKKIHRRTAEATRKAVVSMLTPYRPKTLTIACDNGLEFAGHQEIAEELDADVFFAHPCPKGVLFEYASWERGTNLDSDI